LEALHVCRGIAPGSGADTSRGGQQGDLVVVAQRSHTHPAGRGELSHRPRFLTWNTHGDHARGGRNVRCKTDPYGIPLWDGRVIAHDGQPGQLLGRPAARMSE